jgi:hypothetical protein
VFSQKRLQASENKGTRAQKEAKEKKRGCNLLKTQAGTKTRREGTDAGPVEDHP